MVPPFAGPTAWVRCNWTSGAFLSLECFHLLPAFWGQRLDVLVSLAQHTLPTWSRGVHVSMHTHVHGQAPCTRSFNDGC